MTTTYWKNKISGYVCSDSDITCLYSDYLDEGGSMSFSEYIEDWEEYDASDVSDPGYYELIMTDEEYEEIKEEREDALRISKEDLHQWGLLNKITSH